MSNILFRKYKHCQIDFILLQDFYSTSTIRISSSVRPYSSFIMRSIPFVAWMFTLRLRLFWGCMAFNELTSSLD